MRRFPKFRDPRFALTTLQNPNCEVRTYAELVKAAQPVAPPLSAVQAAAQLAANQPPATPAAPDSIPTTASRENDPSTAPDPAPAPLDFATPDSTIPDSANPDSANPDSTYEDAQQLLDSLVSNVVSAGTSLPSSPTDDELTPRSARKPRRKPKSKSRRKSSACPSPEPTFLERHSRKCAICRHPYRQQIDESFLHWRSPQTIMHCFGIKTETTIYHHAHAFNFFALRNRNLQSALANIVENIDTRDFTGMEMLHAVRSLAHLTEDGRWIHPTSKSEFMYSMQRLPAGPAGLPAAAALSAAPPALSAHTNALSAGLSAVADDEILIASRPIIRKRCNSLKTILTYSG